jgi:hypothetical protein
MVLPFNEREFNSSFWKNIKFFGLPFRGEPHWRKLVKLFTVCGGTRKDLNNMQRLYKLYILRQWNGFNAGVLELINRFPLWALKCTKKLSAKRQKAKKSKKASSSKPAARRVVRTRR